MRFGTGQQGENESKRFSNLLGFRLFALRPHGVSTSLIRLLTIQALFAFYFTLPHQVIALQNNFETWAIVIGISHYARLPGGQQLQFADRDAAAFAEAIEKNGVSKKNIRLLLGAEATVAQIKAALGDWLARSSKEGDTVYIFFSGHGFFEREFNEAYLFGYDSAPEAPYSTAISVSDLRHALASRVRARRVLIISDAARRDFFLDDDEIAAKSFVQAFDQLAASRAGTSVILSSSPGEFSREGRRWDEKGVFTKYLVDALSESGGLGNNGMITAYEVFNYVSRRVAEDTSNKQHPMYRGATLAGIAMSQTPPAIRPPEGERTAAQPLRPDTTRQTEPEQIAKQPSTMPDSRPQSSLPSAKQPEKTETSKPPAPTDTGREPSVRGNESRASTEARNRTSGSPEAPKSNATPRNANSGSSPAVTNPATSTSQPARKNSPPPITRKTEEAKPANASAVSPSGEKAAVTEPPAAKTTVSAPPGSSEIDAINNGGSSAAAPSTKGASTKEPPPAPKPMPPMPSTVPLSSVPSTNRNEETITAQPAPASPAAPSPLLLQFQMAIASGKLIEPKNASAWDIYQQLITNPGASAELPRLKASLADAMTLSGRAIVAGDVRADNISEKVEDFKRAGQMFNRVRTLLPERSEAAVLEKLSAAVALVSLQFYDEAEKALSQLQSEKLAAVENAMGILYTGKLEDWQAERAFKRAIETDPQWAAPHYNLAMLYRDRRTGDALPEFERAVSLDQTNIAMLTALGDEYFSREQWQKAAESYRKAISADPSNDTLHTKLGHALYSQGLREEADREYKKAAELRKKRT